MKKLQPKNPAPVKPPKSFTEKLRETIRTNLLSFIAQTVIACYLKEFGQHPYFEDGEEWSIDLSESEFRFRFDVTVEDPRIDGAEWTEKRVAQEVRVALDHSVFVTYDEDGYQEEQDASEFGETELFDLCETVEKYAGRMGFEFPAPVEGEDIKN